MLTKYLSHPIEEVRILTRFIVKNFKIEDVKYRELKDPHKKLTFLEIDLHQTNQCHQKITLEFYSPIRKKIRLWVSRNLLHYLNVKVHNYQLFPEYYELYYNKSNIKFEDYFKRKENDSY